MRVRRQGRIINISSVNGLLSFGLYGMYSSSKFAIETISEALRFEVKKFGVDVTLVEPGGFKTSFGQNSRRAQKYLSPQTAYVGLKDPLSTENQSKAAFLSSSVVESLANPQQVADEIYRIAGLEKTHIRYQVGLDTKMYTFLRKIVPDWLWEAVLHKAYKW
jgi:short-subunit dehydrogenase